jgi:hypothetical protein
LFNAPQLWFRLPSDPTSGNALAVSLAFGSAKTEVNRPIGEEKPARSARLTGAEKRPKRRELFECLERLELFEGLT